MQETGENNAWRRFIVHILNQVLLLEGMIKECDGGNCFGIDKEWIEKCIRLSVWWMYFWNIILKQTVQECDGTG
jgi:hypothetical protein